MEQQKLKIFVGLSGGVDSSVSAALLKEQGHEVVGVFIKVWQADFLPCTWREERREAMRAAAHLGIPFVTLDLEKAYKEEVVDYMIREYGAGRVPNPDVMCNKHVKFGAFLDYALAQGANAVATGHYARVVKENDQYRLFAGVDKEKDQSYFLWTLTEEQLSHTLFPVGNLEKKEVRELAKKFGLPNAEKKDSQGLCFMGAVDMPEFLRHYLDTKQGQVLDEAGNVVGTHLGALVYTIGQRHGFTTKKLTANEPPYVVVGKDLARNTLTVSYKEPQSSLGGKDYSFVEDLHAICGDVNVLEGSDITARIRYRGALSAVSFAQIQKENHSAKVIFTTPQEGLSFGQSIVFYYHDECLGGAVLCDTPV